jgi:hypothetical protein
MIEAVDAKILFNDEKEAREQSGTKCGAGTYFVISQIKKDVL